MTEVTRAEYCAVACAELFADAGEIFASPMATLPLIGARLAKLTTEPDLIITDGEALILAEAPAIGASAPIEGYIPFSKVFDVVASGRRHVVMGANQIDKYGNQNLSAFGPLDKPTRQMFGLRGAPGNTINHAPATGSAAFPRVFAEKVDVVCGVGYDKVDPENPAFRFLKNHAWSPTGRLRLPGPGQTMRAVTLHPGVTAEDVKANTSFEIADLDSAGVTREPTAEELRLIREVIDPKSLRDREVSA
ncbi:CoA-transferase [Rhodococcus hoagii]|nr:CoA-transferase [Prescottella equi]